MAEIIDLADNGSITLEEAMEQLDAEFNVNEKDCCLQVAHIIKKLGKNKQWLVDFFNKKLIDLSKEASAFSTMQPTSQVFYIAGSDKGYYLRTNVWMPPDSGHSDNIRKTVFVEAVHHDHTFDLLTLSLHGPGYETDLFQYDNSKVYGLVR